MSESSESIELSDGEFRKLRELVYALTGISMSENKRQLLKSRLQRRMRVVGIRNYGEYHNLVANHAATGKSPSGEDEVRFFVNAVTTNKTDFFRENHHFEFITSHVVPEMVTRGQNSIRVWHAGCSTGEEPYTLGMVLRGCQEQFHSLKFAQLASDIDTDVLATAERGVYAEERVNPIPNNVLRSWFLRGKGGQEGFYRVRPELQESLTFRQINLLDEPWPMRSDTRFDLILCRNVLIYFDKPTQKRLFQRFHERLNPGGYLILGHSESMHGEDDRFKSVGKTIYRALHPTLDLRKGRERLAA